MKGIAHSRLYKKGFLPLAKFALAGFLFVGVLCFIRLFLCEPTLGWDEAEQAVIAQQLSAGYSAQPPLYYWLQYFVFRGLGISLFSIALLKYSLVFLCFYVYHQICCFYCQNRLLSWCATLSWVLVPNIGIDLLPHRTHAIVSLLAACLTWLWLIKPSDLAKPLWYAGLGIIIGLGFLSKANYLLFLITLLVSAMTLEEFRAKLVQKAIFISLFFACLVSAIYWLWLIDNFAAGTASAFKLSLSNKTLNNGILQFLKTCLIYGISIAILSIFFPFWREKPRANPANRLLWRYHSVVLPLLLLFIVLANLHDFKTHWALSLFFLIPLFALSWLNKANYPKQAAKHYLIVCLIVQLIILGAWAKRSYRLANFPLEQLVESIKKEKLPRLTLVSPSHWLLGSLMLNFPEQRGFLLHPSLLNKPLPPGKLLLVWKGSKVPAWTDALVPPGPGRQIKKLVKERRVIAGYAY